MESNKALHGRREKLSTQLSELQSQHAGIVEDLQSVETDWQTAVQSGEDTSLIGERRRHRQGELEENERRGAYLQQVLTEIDDEFRRRQPHEQLDTDILAHAADVAALDAATASLDSAVEDTVRNVVEHVTDLHERMHAAADRTAEVISRGQQLRQQSIALDRTDHVAQPANWQQAQEETHRGGDLYGVWLMSISDRHRRRPTEVADAVHQAVRSRVMQPARAADSAARVQRMQAGYRNSTS